MSEMSKNVWKWAFMAMIIIGLVFAAMRTLNFIEMTVPSENKIEAYMFLVFTGMGSFVWLQVFMRNAKGLTRRTISFLMIFFDLGAEMVMVYADTRYVSSTRGLLEMTADDLSMFLLVSVAIVAVNVGAGILYELGDPDKEKERRVEDMMDKLEKAAVTEMNKPEKQKEIVEQMVPLLVSDMAALLYQRVQEAAASAPRVPQARPVLPAPADSALHMPNDLSRAVPVDLAPRTYPADAPLVEPVKEEPTADAVAPFRHGAS